MAATIGVAASSLGQAPFDVDVTFSTTIETGGISSVVPLSDGRVVFSGRLGSPGDPGYWTSSGRFTSAGSLDFSYYISGLGGGKLTPWNELMYVAGGQTVRRLLADGHVDPTWQELELDPYIHILQGGDYHVFPDGRLVITGTHALYDSIRGFVGLYNLIWITADGRLDTTRVHRRGNGDLSKMRELPDGKFIIGGGLTEFEGHPVGNIIRVHPDGALDTTFQTNASWFYPTFYHPLVDGKVICTGDVVFSGSDDTLHVFRLLPDGSLDPTFNNHLAMWRTTDMDGIAGVSSITPLGSDRYIVTGGFDRVEGQFRGGIAVIDTAGYLLDEPLGEVGCGTFWNGFYNIGLIVGIVSDPQSGYYIFGSYHGYNDGTTNDVYQRMVSRLYGLDVGVEEEPVQAGAILSLAPNPATDLIRVNFPTGAGAVNNLEVLDITGQLVLSARPTGQSAVLNVADLRSGVYFVRLITAGAVYPASRFEVLPH